MDTAYSLHKQANTKQETISKNENLSVDFRPSEMYCREQNRHRHMFSPCLPPHHHQQWRRPSAAFTKVGAPPSAARPPLWFHCWW